MSIELSKLEQPLGSAVAGSRPTDAIGAAPASTVRAAYTDAAQEAREHKKSDRRLRTWLLLANVGAWILIILGIRALFF
jgi:hypothetical protein